MTLKCVDNYLIQKQQKERKQQQQQANKQEISKIQRNIKFKMLIRQFEIITKHLIAMRK